MTRITDRLFTAGIDGCHTPKTGVALAHACKSPCHVGKCGKTKQGDANYLSVTDGSDIWLNLIDSPSSHYYPLGLFLEFLKWFKARWLTGDAIEIHCNLGKSRSMSLALLACAKVLGTITNASYDAAWDEFTALVGDYRPTAGIETWLRERWHDIPLSLITPPKIETVPAPSPAKNEADLAAQWRALDPAVKLQMARTQPLVHFATFVEIEHDDKSWRVPTPNILQRRMAEAYDWCIENNQECRIIVLKSRKTGASTFSAELCNHHAQRYHSNMMLMGDNAERTKDIFKMFDGFPKHDMLPRDSTWHSDTEKGHYLYADKTKGFVQLGSAAAERVGIGGTRNIVWMTESARYAKTGQRTDKDVIMALLNSVARTGRVLIIAESTAEGSSGFHFETWQGASTLEERKKGRLGNKWIKIFAAWHEFSEHRLPRNSQTEEFFYKELDEHERQGVRLYRWTWNQIAWRRMKIKTDAGSDVHAYNQDFPSSPEVAFLSSGRPRFNIDGLTRLELMARANHDKAERGILERRDEAVGFLPRQDEESWLWVDERPVFGLKYLCFVDPCLGEQAAGAPDPDAHAVGILRDGYFDAKRKWHPPKLVACIHVEPNGCRWEDTLLGERAAILARWYGNCLIVPEVQGGGAGVIEALREHGANIWQRRKDNAMSPGQTLDIAGFETTKSTRPKIVSALADAIRQQDQGLDCNYLPAVLQLKTFVLDARGKAAAANGRHDDWPLGISLGIYHLEFSTTNTPPRMSPMTATATPATHAGVSSAAFS